ncbi:MAG: insulinase family protein [Bacteroidales bacterium]|nr:insulinase family protein [Candidatus Liminaster caballi]
MSRFLTLLSLLCLLFSCTGTGEYETVAGDPLNARIYTLPNGLKVYMTVNREEPRIQTYIAVRTGSKNDPAETTGLAHYLEHLMFKGTTHFGTQDYEAERPLLDSITTLFEHYRTLTDEAERRALYHVIDSISGVAAQYAIPNEYDKLMSIIGASGTNAYTSEDVTCYVENIPSNQVENWARIQADRFQNPVFRLFHTELEAVYEEKNMSMVRDQRKEFEALDQMLYPHHAYGQQTAIGTQEHLKNPSIINIRNYFNKWYVPNNVAICLSGDFDPDQMIDVIRRHFGSWQPGTDLTPRAFEAEAPITAPQYRDVLGQEAENVMMAWRFEGAATDQAEMLNFVSALIFNGKAGLFDLDLNQAQRVMAAQSFVYDRSDYSAFMTYGMPLPGQSLDDVRQLILSELAKLRAGEFDNELLSSVLTDYKLSEQKQLEDNGSRANMFVNAFINGESWQHFVSSMSRLERITKQDIIDFANQYLRDDNYVCVYKRQAEDPNIRRIDKPVITPVVANRDAVSQFVQDIAQTEVAPIEPVFVDFDADIAKTTLAHGQQMLYRQNETNQTFELEYLYEMGADADPTLPLVSEYTDYLGTSDLTPEQLQKELYRLGCSANISCGARRFYVTLSGLDENLPAALALLDKVLNDAQPDEQVYSVYLDQIQKARANRKLSQGSVFNALRSYTVYGPEYVKAHNLTDAQLRAMPASQLTDCLHGLASLRHRVMYYGPRPMAEVAALVDQHHQTADVLVDAPQNRDFPMLATAETATNFVPYTANNSMMFKFTNLQMTYEPAIEPVLSLYNEYFGGSMNSIVFQEMRETRGLAYSANAWLSSPNLPGKSYSLAAMITTQNDKLPEAYTHFDEIINQMPESEPAFQNALSGLQSRMRTQRTTRSAYLWSYINAQDLGLSEDPDKAIFLKTQSLTLADVVAFQQQYVRDRQYSIVLVSDPKQVDLKFFQSLGKVNKLTLEDVFGY